MRHGDWIFNEYDTLDDSLNLYPWWNNRGADFRAASYSETKDAVRNDVLDMAVRCLFVQARLNVAFTDLDGYLDLMAI